MKFLIASDIHGSAYYTREIIEIFKKEKAQKLVLLGDIYNHGPRNSFPQDYSPMRVSEMLNSIKQVLLVIKGNCDSEVDAMISDFDFMENAVVLSGEKSIFLTHGHIYNKDNIPKTDFDAIIYGHFHTGFIVKENGNVFVNTGSVSLPKNQTPNSYVILDDGVIYLKGLKGNVIEKYEL